MAASLLFQDDVVCVEVLQGEWRVVYIVITYMAKEVLRGKVFECCM